MDELNRPTAGRLDARRCWALIVALIAACYAALALANEIRIHGARLERGDDGGYTLSADFELSLSDRLQDVLSEGVPLYFIIEFECYRPRWYWFDASVAKKKHQVRLSFHALTRTYRLSTGALHQSFNSAKEAVEALGTVRGWHVLEAGDLEPNTSYEVALRMMLDVDQLPKPFQVSALTNRDWTLSSNWERWGFATDAEGKIAQ
ncbi:MAG: DUF4390 domain-containing protein [Burkholderiales bacterium]|nr:DUF4390 domain-containing protein [Burkholderiales bacterium]PZN05151.1 MAG: DUF4390 domain-containing protein [Pseudomonadota bacterium]